MNDSLKFAQWIAQQIDKKGGRGITVFDVRQQSSIADYMIVATGTSSRHMETLIEAPVQELKRSSRTLITVEGQNTPWLAADFSDVVLHVFDEYTRQYYNLEKLWVGCPQIDWENPNLVQTAL